MKFTLVIAAIIGVATVQEVSSVQIKKAGDDFPHWMNGFGGYSTYMRDIPDRFEEEKDDTLMKSLYTNYATEGKSKAGLPNGHFWVNKDNAKRVSEEVIATHLQLKGAALVSFMKAEFETHFEKYDVNDEGKIDVDRMPVFLRTLCGSAEGCLGLQ